MNEYQFEKTHLVTESDVEQKVIFPLITNPEPIGLGFDSTEVLTKASLKKIGIGKGTNYILYYPDYVITIDGIPLIVIEAKKPEEDLIEAFRQAALYASEINRKFKKNLNPCQLIIACDGLKLIAGNWDSTESEFEISVENWNFAEQNFNDFLANFSKSAVAGKVSELKTLIREKAIFKKPLNLLGGKFIRDKTTENNFGETISIQYRHLFNPNVEAERIDIVENAYVKVAKHESHVAPIDRLIRKKITPSINLSTEIIDTTAPAELIEKFENASNYNNQVLLLIGTVGSGKSTFATYLNKVALKENITEKLVWITLDLNNAPISSNEIYNWIKNGIIEQLKSKNQGIDFDHIDFILELYSDKINKLKKGELSLLDVEGSKYKELLVENITRYRADIDITLQSYIDTLVHRKGKELIIVLDNCDKRNLQEQLLMFEVANWVKDTIKAIVFLPLRDTTFDQHRREKPLDTVVKDLIFRVTPPSLQTVLYERIKYANRLSEKSNDRHYVLPNGIKVNYPSSDELYYLKSILTSLFQDYFFRRLITGLAGGDIRVGLEIFLDFCKSGYISASDIFRIRQSKGEFTLQQHIISKVFLRGNRFFYSDADARIKNLFTSDPSDELPDPFVRVAILKWLYDRYKIKGSSGIRGFHVVEEMVNQLIALGHDSKRLYAELLTLLRNSLIINESQKLDKIDPKELISINTSGIIHLELVDNPDYLSTCAEDIWYNIEEMSSTIARNMSGQGIFPRLSLQNVVEHAKIVVSFLESYFNNKFKVYSEILDEKSFVPPLDFEAVKDRVANLEHKILRGEYKQFEEGEVLPATVVSVKNYGIFVNIDNSGQKGLIKLKNIKVANFTEKFSVHDKVLVKIIKYNPDHKKYELSLENE